MDRNVADSLYERALATFHDLVSAAGDLRDEQLDQRVTGFGGREVGVRQILYAAVTHSREHAIHISKILKETGTPGTQPSEAQLVLGQVAESLGALHGVLMRLSDADLGRTHEDQSIQAVLEHVASTHENYARYLREGLNKDS